MTSTLQSTPWSSQIAGIRSRDHWLSVPVDRSGQGITRCDRQGQRQDTMRVYAREIAAPGGESRQPLLFLQGGPGCESPRPSADAGLGWLGALLEGHRVILLDQRGTGRSTPIDRPDAGGDAAQTAQLLTCMRADSIVEDCEDLRRHLGIDTWSILGQSFGGFCVTRYLSAHSQSISRAYLTGGLPAVGHSIDEVYALTYATMMDKSRAYYRRFPEDRDRMSRLMDMARSGELRGADGSRVGVERLRSLGSLLGASGGADTLHALLERDPEDWSFRWDLLHSLAFSGRNPLYAVIHESCWADGGRTAWAAQRCLPAAYEADDTLLTGEHISPAIIEQDPALAPWAEVAQILAEHEWPELYDAEALRSSTVPAAAAVYFRDAYVPVSTSLETAELMPQMSTWVTSEYEHNGSRASGGAVMRRLVALADGQVMR